MAILRAHGVRQGALLLLASLSGCTCVSHTATPVTVRIINDRDTPLYVDDSAGHSGTFLERRVGGEWQRFDETPRCDCFACTAGCAPCSCPEAEPTVRVLQPLGTTERSWSGVVQVASTRSCGIQGSACLEPEPAPANEQFRLSFCYVFQPPAPVALAPDAGRWSGTLDSPTCSHLEFRPDDGLVEIRPAAELACTEDSSCLAPGALCIDGRCRNTCPAHTYPRLGAGWQVQLPEPDDQGLLSPRVDGRQTATGTITAATWSASGTLTLSLKGTATGALATLYVTLPAGAAPALSPGLGVSLLLVDASTPEAPDNRGLVLRDAQGGLLLAAQTGLGGAVLRDTDVAPLALHTEAALSGCGDDACGRQRFHALRVEGGSSPLLLGPGERGVVQVGASVLTALNVTQYDYGGKKSICKNTTVVPWVVYRTP